jgi:tetratricopeptide (TPR) repeat protein
MVFVLEHNKYCGRSTSYDHSMHNCAEVRAVPPARALSMIKHFILSHLLLILRGSGSCFTHWQGCVRHHQIQIGVGESNAKPSNTRSLLMQEVPLKSSSLFLSLSYDDARQLMREGEDAFRRGDVKGSTKAFDEVYRTFSALRPYLWQRGISLYYAGRFQEASEQFQLDVRVNPNDVEEIVWDTASLLQLAPGRFPAKDMLSILSPSKDRRRIMVRLIDHSRAHAQPAFDSLTSAV